MKTVTTIEEFELEVLNTCKEMGWVPTKEDLEALEKGELHEIDEFSARNHFSVSIDSFKKDKTIKVVFFHIPETGNWLDFSVSAETYQDVFSKSLQAIEGLKQRFTK